MSCADKTHSSSVNDECESVSMGTETLGVTVIQDMDDIAYMCRCTWFFSED